MKFHRITEMNNAYCPRCKQDEWGFWVGIWHDLSCWGPWTALYNTWALLTWDDDAFEVGLRAPD